GCVDAYQLEGATTYLVDPYGLSCRKDPGVGRKGANHPDAEKWLRGTHGNAGRVPEPIADALHGREFKNFDDFRGAFWRAIAADEKTSSVFNAEDRARMARGFAPGSHLSQHYGKNKSYVIHHNVPIQHGGGVYDMSNLSIVTPLSHQAILDRSYHFGNG